MNQDQMAWEYLCAMAKSSYSISYEECFDVVDEFLAYCAKEREKEKPKAECEHSWVAGSELQDPYCCKCGAPKVTERRKPKVFLVHESYLVDAETKSELNKENLVSNGYVYVRGIMPGEKE